MMLAMEASAVEQEPPMTMLFEAAAVVATVVVRVVLLFRLEMNTPMAAVAVPITSWIIR